MRNDLRSIWESNGTLLEAVLNKLDQTIHDRRMIADEPSRLKDALQDMADRCDVVVSTGGVSAGDSDWIRTVVDDIGDISFWKLFLKPGRPFAFGQLKGNVPFFGLPGNPVAAAVTALQLLWPALQRLEGRRNRSDFQESKCAWHITQRRAGRPERREGDNAIPTEIFSRDRKARASSRSDRWKTPICWWNAAEQHHSKPAMSFGLNSSAELFSKHLHQVGPG